MNIDYAICQALNYRTQDLPGAIILYDVACKWIIHFLERVVEGLYLDLPQKLQDNIVAAVGKFHINAHVKECFAKYSPNFIKGLGQVDGEIGETLWAIFNMISRAARTTGKAHRREIYNDHMCESNWKKLVGMGETDVKTSGMTLLTESVTVASLLKKYKKAVKGQSETKKAFEGLTKTLPANLVSDWTTAESKAMIERGDALKIFDVKESKGNYVHLNIIIIC